MEQNNIVFIGFSKDPSINVIEKQDSNFNINQNFIKFEKPKNLLRNLKKNKN